MVIYECDDEGDWAISEQQFPQWNNNSHLGPIVDEVSVFELDGNIYASFTYNLNSTYNSSGFYNFYQFSFVNKSEGIWRCINEICKLILNSFLTLTYLYLLNSCKILDAGVPQPTAKTSALVRTPPLYDPLTY